ncbi:hypothetical protein [Hoeflea sp. BAL378]|uniref:hypothetical protein n=1 Tax=Hoeflea sp. BAL378 TaxID=1547437 RepID=UPI00126A447F|nr:hypothetical protein [Hoeflea sp. BAL378]
MYFSRGKQILLAVLFILFAFSAFYYYGRYERNQNLSSLYFGGNEYNFDKISDSMKLRKSFSHTIDGEDYVVQLFVVADKDLNMCDDDEILVTLVWDGASTTDQPDNFKAYTLNPLEKDLYYTLKYYLSSSFEIKNKNFNYNNFYDDLIVGDNNFESTTSKYKIINLKSFLRDRSLNYSKTETRRIVVSDNRVVAWLDYLNGSYEEGGRKFSIKYKDSATDFYVQFTVDIGEGISSGYQCLFDTADAITTEVHSVTVNK